MSTRQEVLKRLEAVPGEYISGGRLSQELGLSRNAVWKAVGELKRGGYPIESSTNRGYRLLKHDILSPQGIARLLRAPIPEDRLRVLACVDSTNRAAKALAEEGAPPWTTVLAEQQTAGQGRRGRPFFSPPGTGLYLSVVLRPQLPLEQAALLTTAAAVAVCRVIETHTPHKPAIKWVNDILLRDRKVCGILTEASADFEDGRVRYAVLGVGVNLARPAGGFPPELGDIATALYPHGAGVSRNQFAAALLDTLHTTCAHPANPAIMDEYRRRCCVPGRRVAFTVDGEPHQGLALAVDDAGGLLVESEGARHRLTRGEITLLP